MATPLFVLGGLLPQIVEDCVESRLADPDFEPREGQTKEESAWALCNWLYEEGKLQESELSKPDSRSFRVTLPIMRVDPPEWATDGMWLRVEASGPERDAHSTRMSDQCLTKFVAYAEEGIDGEPLPFLDGHYQDLLAAMLGDIYAPYLTTERHFAFYVQLDESNPHAMRLYSDVQVGKRHGASISGWAHEFEDETWTDEDGEEHTDLIFHDIELIEVSRTSWPSWQPAFIELVAKRLSTDPLDGSMSRKVRRARRSVVFCNPDGMCMQLVRDDGKANLVTVYAAALSLMHDFAPELAGVEPDRLMEGVLSSGMVSSSSVLDCARSSSGIIADMSLIDRVGLSKQVMGVYRTHLFREPPLQLLTAYGRATDRLGMRQEFGEMLAKSINQEETMGKEENVVEAEATEVPTAGVEEAPDNSQEGAGQGTQRRGLLSDTVDARMLGQRFGEATWAMQDLVWDSLWDSDSSIEDRVARAEAVIAEFATMAVDIVHQMAESGYVPRSADELRQQAVAMVELTEGRLSRVRIDALRGSVGALFQQGVDLMALLERADSELEEEPTEDVEVEEETPQAQEGDEGTENVAAVASSLLDARLAELDAQRRADADRVFTALSRGSGHAGVPAGNTAAAPPATPEVAEAERQAALKTAFVESTFQDASGGTRRVGGRRN